MDRSALNAKDAAMAEADQELEWTQLYQRVVSAMGRFGKQDYLGNADYLIVDDNYGAFRQKIEIHNLQMLQVPVVQALRRLLDDFPSWEIILALDIPGKERQWPPMGVTIRKQEIIDGLRRDLLPEPYRTFVIPGSRLGTGYD